MLIHDLVLVCLRGKPPLKVSHLAANLGRHRVIHKAAFPTEASNWPGWWKPAPLQVILQYYPSLMSCTRCAGEEEAGPNSLVPMVKGLLPGWIQATGRLNVMPKLSFSYNEQRWTWVETRWTGHSFQRQMQGLYGPRVVHISDVFALPISNLSKLLKSLYQS